MPGAHLSQSHRGPASYEGLTQRGGTCQPPGPGPPCVERVDRSSRSRRAPNRKELPDPTCADSTCADRTFWAPYIGAREHFVAQRQCTAARYKGFTLVGDAHRSQDNGLTPRSDNSCPRRERQQRI